MRSLGPLAFFVLVVSFASAPQNAAAADWNQEEVTALAGQLSAAANDLYDAFRKEPSAANPRQSRVYHKLKHLIRLVRIESRHLASELAAGGGHDETLPVYKNLMQIVRKARDEAPKLFTGQSVNEKAEATGALLDQVSAYYEE